MFKRLLGIFIVCTGLAPISYADEAVPSSENETMQFSEDDMKEKYRQWYYEVYVHLVEDYKQCIKNTIKLRLQHLYMADRAIKRGDVSSLAREFEMSDVHFNASGCRNEFATIPFRDTGEFYSILIALYEEGDGFPEFFEKCFKQDQCKCCLQKDINLGISNFNDLKKVIEEESKESD